MPGRPRRCDEPPSPLGLVTAQFCGTVERSGRSRVAASEPCPFGRTLQLRRDVVVGADGRAGAVPSSPVRVVGPDREGGVGPLALREARAPVDRRTDEWMPKADSVVVDAQKSLLLSKLKSRGVYIELGRSPSDRPTVADVLGSCKQQ